jgi:hypothetical protein
MELEVDSVRVLNGRSQAGSGDPRMIVQHLFFLRGQYSSVQKPTTNAWNFHRRMVKRAVLPLAWRALANALLVRRVATWSVIEQFVGLPDPRESSANLRFHPIALCRTPDLGFR